MGQWVALMAEIGAGVLGYFNKPGPVWVSTLKSKI